MKKIVALILACLFIFSCCAVAEDIVEGPKMNLVLASHLAVGSIENQVMQEYIIDELNRRTGGNITGAVYEGGALGSEMEVIEQIINGTCTLALTSYSTIDNYAGEYNTFGIPYFYTSKEEVLASWDGPIGEKVKEAYKANGLGFDYLMFRGNRQLTTNTEVDGPEDLKGLKLRLPENQVSMAVWGSMGALTYPIDSSEVFTALQLGTVDAQENPISSNYSKGLWEVQKYTVLTNHVVDFLGYVWNDSWYQSLTPEYQKLFDEVLAAAAQKATELEVANEAKLRAEMEEKGMQFVEVDTSAFAEAAQPAISELAAGWAEGVYEQALADIASVK